MTQLRTLTSTTYNYIIKHVNPNNSFTLNVSDNQVDYLRYMCITAMSIMSLIKAKGPGTKCVPLYEKDYFQMVTKCFGQLLLNIY